MMIIFALHFLQTTPHPNSTSEPQIDTRTLNFPLDFYARPVEALDAVNRCGHLASICLQSAVLMHAKASHHRHLSFAANRTEQNQQKQQQPQCQYRRTFKYFYDWPAIDENINLRVTTPRGVCGKKRAIFILRSLQNVVVGELSWYKFSSKFSKIAITGNKKSISYGII